MKKNSEFKNERPTVETVEAELNRENPMAYHVKITFDPAVFDR